MTGTPLFIKKYMKNFFNISDLSLNEILSILDIETDLKNNFRKKI